MAKIKKKDTKEKISLQGKQKRGCSCEQYPAFSFRYLTKNSRYNFSYFNTDTERENARSALVERIEEITKYPYTYWLGQRKTYGCELFEFWKCKFNPNEI